MSLPNPTDTLEISCTEVAGWIDSPSGERPLLIDCREQDEWDFCHLPGAELVPLSSFSTKAAALGNGAERGIVVYCHHGMRSLRAATFLRESGFPNAFSMAGGIDGWSREIDPEMPRY